MTLVELERSSPPQAPSPGSSRGCAGGCGWSATSLATRRRRSTAARSQHLVSLVSVEDDATGEELEVVWEIEPGTQVIERAELPAIAADRPR